MPLWIGRYSGDDFFLVWSETRASAVEYVRHRLGGTPDEASLARVDGEGALWFRAAPHTSPWDGELSYYRPSGTHGRLPLVLDDGAEAHLATFVGRDPILDAFPGLRQARAERRHRREAARGPATGSAEEEPLVWLVPSGRSKRPEWDCDCLDRDEVDDEPCARFRGGRGQRRGICVECGHDPECHPLRP